MSHSHDDHRDPTSSNCQKNCPMGTKLLYEQLLDCLRSRKHRTRAISKSGINVNNASSGELGDSFLDVLPVRKVLLENPMDNLNQQATSQNDLHVAVSKNDLISAELLLKKGASPNVVNSNGLTPLHMAAMMKHRAMVQLIFDNAAHAPDLDSCRDYNKETTRDVLKRLLPDLMYQLIANDEKGFLECLKKTSNNVEIDAGKLIAMATRRNFENAIAELLKRRPDDCNLEKATTIAVQKNSPHILRLLLNNFADMNVEAANRLLFTVCIDLGIPGSGGSQDTLNRLECLRLILEGDKVNVRCTDKKGNTPLHYAARADSREAVTMLLAKGSYIGHTNAYGTPAVADISASTLSQYFDNSIQAKREQTNGCIIEFDYKCLNPYDPNLIRQKPEMDLFKYIAGNTGLKHLLKHPLLSSFIYLKWQRIRIILRASFAFHLLHYVLLNVYIIGAARMRTFSKYNDQTDEAVLVAPAAVDTFRMLATVILAIFAFWKLLHVVTWPRCFVSNFRNWTELLLVILEFLVLYDVGPVSMAASVTLLSAWHLVVMMGQYSWLSTDIEILKTVSWNFLRFLAVYALLILAFAVAFFVLFHQNRNFVNLGRSMFKTIIMLTGEFDANEMPFESYPFMSHLVFVLFVFLIVIVLLNLLNGLAVNDITDILCKAELVGLISRIGLISYVENIVIGRNHGHASLWDYCLCNWRLMIPTSLVNQVLVFPKHLKESKLSVELYDSSEMDSGIIKKAKEVLSRRDRESDTERIISELDKVKESLASMDVSLNALRQGLGNNNVKC